MIEPGDCRFIGSIIPFTGLVLPESAKVDGDKVVAIISLDGECQRMLL